MVDRATKMSVFTAEGYRRGGDGDTTPLRAGFASSGDLSYKSCVRWA